ncbi:hypothetical protein [Mycolicibacterium arenosum]|uniref:Uncharacterized protein n=1 Tax=Mycolicibacterium arenosum TaxID=2952157 RepID=A0ABT1M6C2_9MYCO|nr:hypothetical protein [Mycolicibacterium sp. CAU 1645]MCP9274357.1 hypothetical protein [Mycolicibacterium sp. CAU 1645]
MRRRVAAGTVLVAAVVTIGGPGIAVASADPGHGHSRGDRGHHGRDRGGHEDRRDRDHSRDDSRSGDNRGRHDRGGDDDGSTDTDRFRIAEDDSGSERIDANDSTSGGITSGVTATRTATAESDSAGVQSVGPVDAPAVPGTATAEPVVPVSGGGAALAEVPIKRPTVVVGNGRTPGVPSIGPAGAEAPVATPVQVTEAPAAPLPPVVIAPIPAASIPDPDAPLPWVTSEIWSPIGPGGNDNALFGLAGLVLIPLAGVWLGYRQALAARAAAALASR